MEFTLVSLASEPSPARLRAMVEMLAEVFSGPEWYDVQRCAACDRPYPGPVATRPSADAAYAEGMPCWDCGKPLHLIDFWRDPPENPFGVQLLREARETPGFIGYIAEDGSGRLLGIAWGFPLPHKDGEVKFEAARRLIAQHGIDPDRVFYAAELGVVPDARRHGVAQALVRARLTAARDAGYDAVCFRTVDRTRLVGLYEKLFGASNVRELFRDPDPVKAQLWYAAPLDRLAA
jgi:GNAT superfamily N-acetyltransferase